MQNLQFKFGIKTGFARKKPSGYRLFLMVFLKNWEFLLLGNIKLINLTILDSYLRI